MAIKLSDVRRNSKKGEREIGYYIEGKQRSNFVFKIMKTNFSKDTLVEIFNGKTKNYITCDFSVKKQKFQNLCFDKGNFCFSDNLSKEEFELIMHKERVNYTNRKYI